MTATLTPQAALRELRTLVPDTRAYLAILERAARRRALLRYGNDPVGWMNEYVWCKDFEARPPCVFKLTLWPWQADFVTEFFEHKGPEPYREIILKSRGVGATTTSISLATYLAWARAPHQTLIESETEPKAWDLMRRHKFTVSRLPPEIGYPTPGSGDADNLSSRIFPNGSEIHSLSGNPDAIHTYHPSLILIDEAAYVREDFRAAIIGTKADVIVMSTANGM